MNCIKNWWDRFAEKYPKASQWIREGGLFVIVSNVITVFKYLLLTFLPAAFAFLGSRDFGFPGIDLTLFGISFKWYIIGTTVLNGGVSMVVFFVVNKIIFPQGEPKKA